MMKRTLVALVGVLALVVAACASDGTDGANGQTGATQVTVTVTEFEFQPTSIQVPADTPFELVLENKGVVEHDLSIDELGILIHADAGETVTETLTIPAGTYPIYCSVPGHHEAGMEGTITAG